MLLYTSVFALFLCQEALTLLRFVESSFCNKWLYLKTMEYCISNHTVQNHTVADQMCRSVTADLAILTDIIVQDFLINEVLKHANFPPYQYFVGQSENSSVTVWENKSDATLGFSFWRPEQPDNRRNISLDYESSTNDDYARPSVAEESTRAKYICERLTQRDGCSSDGQICHKKALCMYVRGKFHCVCTTGYEGNGVNCLDINECVSNVPSCHNDAVCINLPGSFACICNVGYNGSGTTCSDINECFHGLDNCHINAQCSNSVGSYYCACHSGYIGNGVSCTDFDECQTTYHVCQSTGYCVNTNGGYYCKCDSGYVWNGTNCTDIDECSDGTHNCSDGGVCINARGYFFCTCMLGYGGNGVNCTDIDECVVNTHLCGDMQCVNLIGSYTCNCDEGYKWSMTGCKDVDECSTIVTNCHRDATCFNLVGSFVCKCDPGFTGSGVDCTDIDECLSNTFFCPEHTTCVNKVGTYTCICGSGHVWYRDQCIVNTTTSSPIVRDITLPVTTSIATEMSFQNTSFFSMLHNGTDRSSSENASLLQGRADNAQDLEENEMAGVPGQVSTANPAMYIFAGAVVVGVLCLGIAIFVAKPYINIGAGRNAIRRREFKRNRLNPVKHKVEPRSSIIEDNREDSPPLDVVEESSLESIVHQSSSEDDLFHDTLNNV